MSVHSIYAMFYEGVPKLTSAARYMMTAPCLMPVTYTVKMALYWIVRAVKE